MNSQDLHNLQEAYMEVYDEGYKSFPHEKVKAKVKQLKTDRESLGKKPLTGKSDSEISDALDKMERSRNRETRLGLQSNIAHSFVPKQKEKSNRNRPESEKRSKTVEPQKSFGNRLTRSDKQGIRDSYEYDLYDIILSHLLDEGYAETQEQAEVIMVNMSEDWRESIMEEVLDEKIATPPSWLNTRRRLDPEKRRLRRSRDFYTYGGENQDPDERTISTSKGEGGITKNPKKLRKQKAIGEHG